MQKVVLVIGDIAADGMQLLRLQKVQATKIGDSVLITNAAEETELLKTANVADGEAGTEVINGNGMCKQRGKDLEIQRSTTFQKDVTIIAQEVNEMTEERRREAEEIDQEQMKLAGMVEKNAELAKVAINAFVMAYMMLEGRAA